MELKKAIEQILPHYEKAVIEMPKEGHYDWLCLRSMEYGICHYSITKLGRNTIKLMQDEMNTDSSEYIGSERPKFHFTYEENLQQIQNRVDWMREYLSKN